MGTTKKGLVLAIMALFVLVFVAFGCSTQGTTGNEPEKVADVSEYFKGKTIRFLIPFQPGSAYDLYPRLISPHLEKITGAKFIHENLEGAGGMIMINELYKSKPDGLTLAVIPVTGAISAQIAEASGLNYDMKKLTWIGRFVDEPQVILVKKDSPYNSLDEILKLDGFKIAASGTSGSTFSNAMVLKVAFAAPIDIVAGYQGSNDAMQGFLRGDVDGYTLSAGSTVLRSSMGSLRILAILGSEPLKDFPEAQLIKEFVKAEDTQAILDSYIPTLDLMRSAAASPGVAPEIADYLREAFAQASAEPEYIAAIEKAGMTVNLMPGKQVQEKIENIFDNMTPKLVEEFKKYYK